MKRSTVCECKIGRRANFAAVAGLIAQQNMFESSIFEEHCTGSQQILVNQPAADVVHCCS